MSDPTTQLIPLFYLNVGGTPASKELYSSVEEITVESSLHLPDVATITIRDQELRWIDNDEFAPGKELRISAKIGREQKVIFDGEVVEIEPIFDQATPRLIVRAFDRLHRLSRGQLVRRFVNKSDGDLAKQIAGEVGLQAKLGPTPQVHPFIIQANQSNLAFLQARAAALGFLLYVDGKDLHFKPPAAVGAPIQLNWGIELSEFRPRMSTIGQIDEVTARGWDPAAKQEVVGQAKNSKLPPQVGKEKDGGSLAKKAFSITAKQMVVDRPIRTQGYANRLAQAAVDRHASRFIEAEGVCMGTPELIAGASVRIEKVGKRFGGTYFVTSATHTFGPGEYSTRFSVSGLEPSTLLAKLTPEPEEGVPTGLAIGVVTDNNDPEKLGRVKLKYPWLSADVVSDWVRVMGPGAGPNRGICFLPEVNDEVLVGFELGDFHHPYVLGGLWNGKDKPPAAEKAGYLIDGGKVAQRVLRTRAGHELRFEEDGSGNKGYIRLKTPAGRIIEISDTDKGIELKSAQHTVKLDDQGRLLKIDSGGDIQMTAKGKITIQAQTGLELKSNATASLQANAALDIKSNATASLQANATLDVKSSAILTIQGTLVKIN